MKTLNMYNRYEPVTINLSFFFPDNTTQSEDKETYADILHDLEELGDKYAKNGRIDKQIWEIAVCERMAQCVKGMRNENQR